MEQEYPFRDWIADIIAWCSATTLDEERKGPQIELALGGTARSLVRELPAQAKRFGAEVDLEDGQGPQRLSGAAYILQALCKSWMPLEDETNLRALADLYGFQKLPHENIDTMLTRWEIVMQRARTRANINIAPHHAAWMLLLALRIPAEYWVHVLGPTRGKLPADEVQYRAFTEYLTRFGHIAENGAMNMMQGATQGPSTFHTDKQIYPTYTGGCAMFAMFSGTGAGAWPPPPGPGEYDTHENYDYNHEYYYYT